MIKIKKTKIFVSAYACEPHRGSEIGVGWNWIKQMSKYFDLWVMTRKSNKANIDLWICNHGNKNDIKFVYFDLPKALIFWKKGLRGVKFYYHLWQIFSDEVVKRTMTCNNIKIYHLLTYGNALWPASSYGQKQFFIWGPTSVGDVIPKEFSKHYDLKGQIIEFLRRLLKYTLFLNFGFKKRSKNANLILCKTKNTIYNLPTKHLNKAVLFSDVAIKNTNTNFCKSKIKKKSKYINILAAGRLESWRGFDLLIEAFKISFNKNKSLRLEILGEGDDYNRLSRLIDKHKVSEYVILSGEISIKKYYNKILNCDFIVNPCLKEGGVTVAFDSMYYGKPLICIDTGGYTNYFNKSHSYVIKIKNRNQVIEDISNKIIKLSNIRVREAFSHKSNLAGKNFTWDNKGQEIYNLIKKSFEKHNKC